MPYNCLLLLALPAAPPVSVPFLTLWPVPATRAASFLLLLALLGTPYYQSPDPQPRHQNYCLKGDQTMIHPYRCVTWLPA